MNPHDRDEYALAEWVFLALMAVAVAIVVVDLLFLT